MIFDEEDVERGSWIKWLEEIFGFTIYGYAEIFS